MGKALKTNMEFLDALPAVTVFQTAKYEKHTKSQPSKLNFAFHLYSFHL